MYHAVKRAMHYAVNSSHAIVGGTAMTQPLGNCPGCGSDEPFEPVHADDQCPDTGSECPEWTCPACGTGVFMGTMTIGTPTAGASEVTVPARQSVRAA
jgi:hypothetical protein